MGGYPDAGNAIGDYVEMTPTYQWSQRLAQALTTDTLSATGNATVGGTLGVTGLFTPTGGFSNATMINPYKFSVYLNSAQNTVNGNAKILFDTKLFDTGSNVDVVTNHRFTAPVAGFYQFNWSVQCGGVGPAGGTFTTQLYKNAAPTVNGSYVSSTSNYQVSNGSYIMQLAANDYIEVYVQCTNVVAMAPGSASIFFNGLLVSAT
jgi:hypothetical protein